MGLHFVYLDQLQGHESNLKYSNAPNLHNMGGGAKFERDFFTLKLLALSTAQRVILLWTGVLPCKRLFK